jgi:hypothetical protein
MARTGSRVLDRLVDATNAHDVRAMMESFHEDYRSEQPLHPQAGFSGRDQVGKNWSLMFEEVPDLRLDVVRSAQAGDEVWMELRVHGRQVDGTAFEYRGMTVWGVREDRIAWARLYFERVEVSGPDIDERMQELLGGDR